MSVRDEVLNWFEEARSDLRHSEASYNISDYNWACFAAQQTVENALRALDPHIIGEYLRGHDLVKIYGRVKNSIDIEIDESSLAKLSVYYTIARYPNAGLERPSIEIKIEHVREALSFAKRVLDEVEKIIRDP